MLGWIADFFRFWWALFYWNTRKTWFRLRGAHRDDCPCQTYGDSGHALDSRCDAVIHWQHPARFQRVCPLLTSTPQGWRCGADAERVRPFWGRAGLYFIGLALVLYLIGTTMVYTVLRTTGYEVGYLSVAWPSQWDELRAAQEKLYAARAQAALAAGNYQEAILSLEMVCQINPHNYAAGLALASLSQVASQPFVSEHIYERLMRDVPEQRLQTAQIWFRTLLARAAYDKIKPLALAMLSEDPDQRSAWLHALLFSARQTEDAGFLGHALQEHPHLPDWCTELIGLEQSLLQNPKGSVPPGLVRINRLPSSYVPYYQIDRLLHDARYDEANILLNAYDGRLPPDEASFLRLRLYQAKGWTSLLAGETDNLLQYPMAPRIAAQFCAYLVNYPDAQIFARYFDRFVLQGPPLETANIPLYQATYLVAALVGDAKRAETIAARIKQYTASDARVLQGLAELLRAEKDDGRLPRILPLVPLPTEVIYAILEHEQPVPQP